MNSVALILSLISAVLHGSRDLVTKKAQDKELFVFCYELMALLLFAPLAAVVFWQHGPPSSSALKWCLIGSLCHGIYYLGLARALHHGDLSLVYPVMRSAPALILLFSVAILGESVSVAGAAGVILVVAGVYVMQLKQCSLSEFFAPFWAASRESSLRWAFFTMIIIAVYSLVDKKGVSFINPVLYLYLINIGAILVYGSYILSCRKWKEIKAEWSLSPASVATNGLLVTLGYLLILYAYRYERISYVQAVRQLSILVAVFWGGSVLKEEQWGIRLFGSALVMMGTMMVVLAG